MKTNRLTKLLELTGLLRLNLQGNPISEEQIEALREALPGCEIIF